MVESELLLYRIIICFIPSPSCDTEHDTKAQYKKLQLQIKVSLRSLKWFHI